MPIRSFAFVLLSLLAIASPLVAAPDTTAQCSVRFDAIWSAGTHPTDFPPNAHFSGLIGGTHNGQVVFWAPGGLATPGIESMAETGSKTLLQGEVQGAITVGDAAAVISGGGIGISPGSVSAAFSIDLTHPLVTVVSMIAPSPDWFVGTHGLSLFAGTRWVEQLVVDLPAYDAGTDSGISFQSGDLPTVPPDPIAEITGHPFVGGTSLGTFTFDCTSALVFTTGSEDGTLDDWTFSVP